MATLTANSSVTSSSCCCEVHKSEEKPLEFFGEKAKCELVSFEELPEFLKDNEFIFGYYRSEWPLKETILSIFSIHNETVNVWTHLIGFFIFLCLTVFTAMMIPRETIDMLMLPASSSSSSSLMNETNGLKKGHPEVVVSRNPSSCSSSSSPVSSEEVESISLSSSSSSSSASEVASNWQISEMLTSCLPKRSSQDDKNITSSCSLLSSVKEEIASMIGSVVAPPISRWPFFAFLGGAMFCLLTSSVCHLVSCHSESMSCLMLRLDYTGIAALIVTSFFPPVYYSFTCHPFFCNLYISFIAAFGVAAVSVSLVPVFQTAAYRPVRAALFFCMGVSGVVPIVHKLIVFGHRPEAVATTGYELLMGTFYGLGVAVYVARVPERWMPGKFDLLGHSHQLFHVLVIAGAYSHYLAGLVYLKWRDSDRC